MVSIVTDEVKDAILSSHIFKVSLDTAQISPEYLEALLRSQIGQIQFLQNNNGAVIPEISQTALKSIRVVLPSASIQNHIGSFMRSAYAEKKQKEQEANALLDSIDGYVLKALGIEIPQQKEKTLKTAFLLQRSAKYLDGDLIRRCIIRFTHYIRNPTGWKAFKTVSLLTRQLPFMSTSRTQI